MNTGFAAYATNETNYAPGSTRFFGRERYGFAQFEFPFEVNGVLTQQPLTTGIGLFMVPPGQVNVPTLSAEDITATSATLSWTDASTVVNATSYKLFSWTDTTVPRPASTVIYQGVELTFGVTVPTGTGTVYYEVVAYDAQGEPVGLSNIVTVNYANQSTTSDNLVDGSQSILGNNVITFNAP